MRFVTPLLAALVALAPLAVRAQGAPGGGPAGPPTGIAGRVLDEAAGGPIPSATVAVYTDGAFVTGTAAGADGAFTLSPLRPATYEVRISAVGYATHTRADVAVRPGAVTPLGDVLLAAATYELGEAETTAQREAVEQQADRTVYNVANQPVTAGGSALETLQTLPALDVDTDGNVSLRGNQNVAVHINGRPVPVTGAQLAGMLRQIPANQIERIEVIPNPSARHDASDMGGIVNIVMRQGTSRGLSGGFTLGGGTAPNGELSGNVAYQQGPWDVSANYGFRYDAFNLDAESNRTVGLTGTPRTTLQAFSMDHGFTSHLLNTTVDYTLRQGLNATFTGSVSSRTGETDHYTQYLAGPQGAGADEETDRWTDGAHDGLNGDVALGLRREFAQGHTLSGEGRYTRNWDQDDDRFLNRLTDPVTGFPTAADDVSWNIIDYTTDEGYFQLDYVRPIPGGRIELGGKSTLRRQDNDVDFRACNGGGVTSPDDVDCVGGTFVVDPNRANRFVLDETVHAAYLQGARTFGPVEAQVGLRVESASRSYDLTAEGQDQDRDLGTQTDLFPSAFLTYNVAQGTLAKASYSRRINRPRPFFLSPFTTLDDPLNVRVGNPDLRPEFTDAFELTLQYKYFLTLAPFYRRTTDVIRQRLTVDPVSGVSTFGVANFDSDESYGADLTLAAQLGGGRYRGFLSGSVYRSVTDGGSIEAGLGSDGIGWSVRGNVQARLRQGTDLQLFAFYRGPLDVPDGHISSFGIGTIGISQKLMGDRATLAVRVNDFLSTSRFRWTQDDPAGGYTFDGFRDPDIRQVTATFTYTFGQAPQRRPRPQTQQQQPQGQQDTGFGF